jgi:hypothetical protein
MTVVDLTSPLHTSKLLEAAQRIGGHAVMPRQLFVEQLTEQLKLFTEKEVPREVIGQVWDVRMQSEA